MGKQITMTPVTRIEGHAKVLVDINDAGGVEKAHLQVMEIRGFEKFIEKMELFKMPQFTARICGVCPAAHHLVSITAIENGLGVEVPKDAKLLRELLYVGHILHSHALSTFLLLGPDLMLGIDSPPADRNVFGMLKSDPKLAQKALRLRTLGQLTVEIIGGRGVHPVTAIPGGMSFRPADDQLSRICGWGEEALQLLDDLSEAVRTRIDSVKDIRQMTELPFLPMALSQKGQIDYLSGEVHVTETNGDLLKSYPSSAYADNIVESVMPGSYMKSVRIRGYENRLQIVGPLARMRANAHLSTPKADGLMQSFQGSQGGTMSVVDFITSRVIEMVHCAERMTEIPKMMGAGPVKTADPSPREGRFIGLVEAPRGILIHDYTADKDGRLLRANLVVATQNNYDAIDGSVTAVASALYGKKEEEAFLNSIEFVIRCFDPCLACATHALGRMPFEVIIQKKDEIIRRIERR